MSKRKAELNITDQSNSLVLLPVAPGLCPVCATDHTPDQPHNAQSLYYGMAFKMQHGRDVTWADAIAHCAPEVQSAWRRELMRRKAWTEPAEGGGVYGYSELENRLHLLHGVLEQVSFDQDDAMAMKIIPKEKI